MEYIEREKKISFPKDWEEFWKNQWLPLKWSEESLWLTNVAIERAVILMT